MTRALAVILVTLVLAGCAQLPEPLQPGASRAPPAEPTAASPSPPAHAPALAPLRVHYVDVGQGDGTLWQLPDGSLVVYDCGPAAASADANPMVRKLRELGAARGSTIFALVASHGHLDHIGGCDEVLDEYRVANVYEAWYDGADAPASYARFRAKLAAEGARVHTLRATDDVDGEVVLRAGDAAIELPAASGATARIVAPASFPPGSWDQIADDSLVVRLSYGATTFCFQGDIEAAQERALARALGAAARCDVYLVGHHGSRFASSDEWLAAMRPAHAVVSFGENPYGHPTSEALCRVQQAGARVYATHRAGDVTFTSDGANVTTTSAPEMVDPCAVGASSWK